MNIFDIFVFYIAVYIVWAPRHRISHYTVYPDLQVKPLDNELLFLLMEVQL